MKILFDGMPHLIGRIKRRGISLLKPYTLFSIQNWHFYPCKQCFDIFIGEQDLIFQHFNIPQEAIKSLWNRMNQNLRTRFNKSTFQLLVTLLKKGSYHFRWITTYNILSINS